MILMSLALLGGLVLPAAAAQATGSATLIGSCEPPPPIVTGFDTLLQCRFRATNMGAAPIVGAQLGFVPSNAAPPPGRYYFFSARLVGGSQTKIGSGNTIFDLGDIPPNQTATLDVEIIVRSSQPYGADVVLLAQPSQRQFAQITLTNSVGGVAPAPALKVEIGPLTSLGGSFDQSDGPPYQRAPLALSIINEETAAVRDLDVEVAFGSGVAFQPSGPDGWTLDPASGHLSLRIAELAAGERRGLVLPLGASTCAAADAAVVVTYEGRHTAALDDGSMLGTCDSVDAPSGLARGGFGPAPGGSGGEEAIGIALLAAGVIALGAGVTMRRRA